MSELIKGLLVDDESRCEHWHSDLDVVALKFKCCPAVYYCCYSCHLEVNNIDPETGSAPNGQHQIEKFSRSDDTVKLIMCGACKTEMTFTEYTKNMKCYNCKHDFNPRCKLHYDLYFTQ
ncbi:hypothetical protein ACO0QE_004776 [Hanseniaspora vineae]